MTSAPEGHLRQSQADERIGAEADAWLARFNTGMLSGEEARAFNQWLAADPEHERVFRLGQEAMRNAQLMRGEADFEALMRPSWYERLHGALYELTLVARRWSRSLPVLAATGALAATSAGLFVYLQSAPAPELPAAEIVTAARPMYETGKAEIREIVLQDGSVITLGAASALDVAFTATERRVTLSAGEAFFDVREDAARPFMVVADNTLVRVLGTKFDVNLGEGAVDIAVLEGRVEVIRPEGALDAIRDADVKHVLTAGQKVAASKTGRVQPVETVESENVAAWRRGELIWVDKPVREIIADLNRYSDAPIRLSDPALADQEYTLAIRADDLTGGVETLAAALGVTVHAGSDGGVDLR